MFSLSRLFILCWLVGAGVVASAFDVPPLTGPVIDEVGFISSQTAAGLSEKLHQVYLNDGIQVQVFITSSLQNEGIEEAATKIFEKWQLGKEKTDQGVLFLIAPNDKKLRIEVGRGLEGDIPDAVAKRIIADTVAPYFKNKDYDMGVMQGVAAILHYAHSSDTEQPPAQDQVEPSRLSSKVIGIGVFVIWLLIFMMNPSLGFLLLLGGRGRGRDGGGFGGGGGGWSGGGGSSAGGGASGSW